MSDNQRFDDYVVSLFNWIDKNHPHLRERWWEKELVYKDGKVIGTVSPPAG